MKTTTRAPIPNLCRSLRCWWAAFLAPALLSCDGRLPAEPFTDPTPAQANAVVYFSGGGQQGETGRLLDDPLVVLVIDAGNRPVANVQVEWTVTAGSGRLGATAGLLADGPVVTTTNAAGQASSFFLPQAAGSSSVQASVKDRSELPPVTFIATAESRPAAILSVSGDWQRGQTGQLLSAPLVVRVVDGADVPMRDITVEWTVISGSGQLHNSADQAVDGPMATNTNENGLASAHFRPQVAGISMVRASLRERPQVPVIVFSVEAESRPAALLYVSGDAQEGKTDHILAEPLVVRVLDGQGMGLGNVPVTWVTTSGQGRLQTAAGPFVDAPVTVYTDPGGLASTRFIPRSLGAVTIEARINQAPQIPATFSAAVTTLVIWTTSDGFYGQGVPKTVFAVPAGTQIEWSLDWWTTMAAHIASTEAPTDGEHFDSGVFGFPQEVSQVEHDTCCFTFTPKVSGTWGFIDKLTGATGTLTVH